MRRNTKLWVLLWALALLPLIVTALLYKKLPQQVPVQWGLDGTVRYDSRNTIWMISGMGPLFAGMLYLLPKIDPRKRNYEKFQGWYEGFGIVLMIFLDVMTFVILSESFNPGHISVDTVVIIAVGILLTFIGNMMPKMKSNFFMGVKNPWTLSNTEVWNKTHRLAGFLFFAAGLLIIASAFFSNAMLKFGIVMGVVLVVALIPTVMSYVWYRRLGSDGHNEEKEEDH